MKNLRVNNGPLAQVFGYQHCFRMPHIFHDFSSEQLRVTCTNKKDPGSPHHDIFEIKWVGRCQPTGQT